MRLPGVKGGVKRFRHSLIVGRRLLPCRQQRRRCLKCRGKTGNL